MINQIARAGWRGRAGADVQGRTGGCAGRTRRRPILLRCAHRRRERGRRAEIWTALEQTLFSVYIYIFIIYTICIGAPRRRRVHPSLPFPPRIRDTAKGQNGKCPERRGLGGGSSAASDDKCTMRLLRSAAASAGTIRPSTAAGNCNNCRESETQISRVSTCDRVGPTWQRDNVLMQICN